MKRTLLALTLAASLSGCATIGTVASSKGAFVACQAVDVATTVAIVGGGGTELNPLMAGLMKHGWLPFIAYKAALVWLVYYMDWSPPVQTAVNVAACLPVPYNLGNL